MYLTESRVEKVSYFEGDLNFLSFVSSGHYEAYISICLFWKKVCCVIPYLGHLQTLLIKAYEVRIFKIWNRFKFLLTNYGNGTKRHAIIHHDLHITKEQTTYLGWTVLSWFCLYNVLYFSVTCELCMRIRKKYFKKLSVNTLSYCITLVWHFFRFLQLHRLIIYDILHNTTNSC